MHRIIHLTRRCIDLLRQTDTLPLLVTTAACLLLREHYPLSHFPMYSSFASKTHYVYLADGGGRPLATVPTAGMNTPALKKIFDNQLREERRRRNGESAGTRDAELRRAGEQVLAAVKSSPAADAAGEAFPDVLRLYRVEIELTGGRIEKRTALVAEIR